MDLVAVRPTDVKSVDYKDSGVVFEIRPLPLKVKKAIMNEQAKLAYNNHKLVDIAGMALNAVKYGCAGWTGLNYSDGKEAKAEFETCKEYKVECLTEDSLDLLYRTSAFDDLAVMCKEPSSVEGYIKESVRLKEDKEDLSPAPIEKKSSQSQETLGT